MVSTPFDYVGVDRFEDAVRLLAEHGDEAKIIAGGQSLVPMLNLRLARPGVLVDINPIGAAEPSIDGNTLRIPALSRHRTVLEHPMIRRHSPLLSDAASYVGNVRVRNRGTLGGSLAHCDPTSEFAACALVLHASVTALGEQGERRIEADELFLSYLTTSLEPTEVVTAIDVPIRGERQGWSFQEMVRRASDFAIVAVAVRLDLSADQISAVDVAVAGTSERVELIDAEPLSELLGSAGDPDVLDRVAARIAATTDPSSDVHASGDYRKELVHVLARRGLTEAYARATGGALMTTRRPMSFTLNGIETEVYAAPSDLLLDVLHDELGMSEVRYGCGEGVCGTCTVLLDGDPVNGCLTFAVQVEGHQVTTLRGIMGDDGSMHPLQECFLRRAASQCGFCTPGMLLVSLDMCRRTETPLTREQIRYGLVGNLCRCTGYTKIVDAVEEYAASEAAVADRKGLTS